MLKFIARLMKFGGERMPVVEAPVQSGADRFAQQEAQEHALAKEREAQRKAGMSTEKKWETIEVPVEPKHTVNAEEVELDKAA